MDQEPARRTWNRPNIGLVAASAILAALIGSAVLWLSVCENRNRVYLLEDGNFTMGSPTAKPMTAREVADRFRKLEMLPGRVVIEPPPDVPNPDCPPTPAGRILRALKCLRDWRFEADPEN